MGKPKTGVEKKCLHCGALFYVQAYRAEKAEFCSMDCLWTGRKRRDKSMTDVKCEQCCKTYSVETFRVSKTRFCSFQCGGIACDKGGRLAQARGKRKPRPKVPKDEQKRRKAEYDVRWRAKNTEAIRKYNAKRYLDLREERLVKNKRWRNENYDKVREGNRAKRQKNGDKLRAARRQHYLDNKARYKAQAVARKDYIKQATPPWADLKKIAAIYAEAERLTMETGVNHHVDHFYPLRGKTMCGLHVEGNLRIIDMIDNLRKGNMEPIGISGMIGI